MKDQLRRAYEGIRMKPLLPHVGVECIIERDDAHADVVRHVCADYRFLRSRNRARVIDCIPESIRPQRTLGFEHCEVSNRLVRLDHQRQHSCIWSDYELAAQPTLESEIRHAKPAVLICMSAVSNVVCGFRDSPRHLPLTTVADLPVYCSLMSLAQQRRGECPQNESRHEVLEHAAAPRYERARSTSDGERPPEPEPVVYRYVILCNRKER